MENYVIHFHKASIHITDTSRPIKEQLIRLIDSATIPQEQQCWTATANLLIAAIQPVCIYKVEHQVTVRDEVKHHHNLIILLPNYITKAIAEYEPILQLAHQGKEGIQCSFHRVHTVVEWIAKGHPFFCRNLVKENLVYTDGSMELPKADPAVVQQMQEELGRQFAVFFGKALEFFRCALFLRDREQGKPALIAFMLHQAVELGYRSILESLNGYCKKTHDIRQLRTQTLRCAPALSEIFPEDTKEEKMLVDVLEASYSGARYNHSYQVTEAMLAKLVERVKDFLDKADELGTIS